MAIDTFQVRMSAALQKEEDDAATLKQKYGCEVSRFGQALLADNFRGYLKNHPDRLYIRWLSDLLVARPDLCMVNEVESMWLVDSKYSPLPNTYDNWLLEKSAHEAHRLQRIALSLPTVYIWPDGCTCSYVEDLPDEVLIDGPWRGTGSGTPFWLVPKKLARSLDEVFGKGISA